MEGLCVPLEPPASYAQPTPAPSPTCSQLSPISHKSLLALPPLNHSLTQGSSHVPQAIHGGPAVCQELPGTLRGQ